MASQWRHPPGATPPPRAPSRAPSGNEISVRVRVLSRGLLAHFTPADLAGRTRTLADQAEEPGLFDLVSAELAPRAREPPHTPPPHPRIVTSTRHGERSARAHRFFPNELHWYRRPETSATPPAKWSSSVATSPSAAGPSLPERCGAPSCTYGLSAVRSTMTENARIVNDGTKCATLTRHHSRARQALRQIAPQSRVSQF